MASLHPEFDQWMVMTGYGRFLVAGIRSATTRARCTAVLADQRAWPQLESHAAGAVCCGASSGDVLTSLGLWSVSVSDQMSEIALKHVERALGPRRLSLNGTKLHDTVRSTAFPTGILDIGHNVDTDRGKHAHLPS